ncbi:MAG: Hsp20/alpha crystallin family protein [Candidatus Hydrogenedentes bacterium]|nr:Hsp20/alpha crystallin family protein [Candidatus Hydrogenedentota bacterium]
MRALTPYRRNSLFPFAGLDDLERIFDAFIAPVSAEGAQWAPAVDLRETEDAYLLDVDLPGMEKKDIEVKIEDEIVTIRGERAQDKEENTKGYHRFERSYGSFHRSFRIPGGVEAERVAAEFKSGVLHVRLPKPETAKPKLIEVTVK